MNVDKLINLHACSEAVEWAASQKSWRAAWDACERGDWMLLLLGKGAGPVGSRKRKPLAMCEVDVAKLASPYAGSTRKAYLRVCRVVKAWNNGTATIEAVRTAAFAAFVAATDSADDVAYADSAYAFTTDSGFAADAFADAAAARSALLAKAANIVRKHYPRCPRFWQTGTDQPKKGDVVCPQCGSKEVKYPRNDSAYCEDCGWPDEDFADQPKKDDACEGRKRELAEFAEYCIRDSGGDPSMPKKEDAA